MSENKEKKTLIIQGVLFMLTLISTTLAGAEWMTGKMLLYGLETLSWDEFIGGLAFSIPFLGILSVHEFGHYFTAKYHRVKVTLPFYIPLWFGFLGEISIGTMGALIKIKEQITDRTKYFDIGISGPLAGFVVALGVLHYGFTHLPDPEHIYNIHPDYETFGLEYADEVYSYEYNVFRHHRSYLAYRANDSINYVQEHGTTEDWYYPEFEAYDAYPSYAMGTTLLFEWMKSWLVDDPSLIPNEFEIAHYPFLFAGFLALFFTSLNLLPIGQLDGGHILYGLIGGKNHMWASRILFVGFLYYAGLGLFNPFQFSDYFFSEMLYVGFLYFCFYRFTPERKDRFMYALAMFVAQLVTLLIFPQAEGYVGWLLFTFILGRVLGIYHPPVINNQPLDTKRKVLGWFALFVFVISFSPQPFQIKMAHKNDKILETPSVLSVTNPSPNCVRIDMPNSRPLASRKCMNSKEEMRVLDLIPSGSKN